MVPVRKPGRPLSSCPHPSAKSCSCGTVTAAIPRKQTCGCGTSDSTTPQSKAETEDTSPATSPDESRPLPTPTSSSFRVQKTKGGANRKMSIDPASLERMDSSQLNVLPSPSSYGAGNGMPPASVGMPNGHIPAMAGLNHFPIVGMQGAEHAFSPQPIMFPMFHPHMPSPMMGSALPTPAPAPVPTPAPSIKSQRNSSISVQPASGSCCGAGAVEERDSDSSQSDTNHVHSVPQASKPRSNGAAPKASCCSSKPPANDTQLPPGTLTPPEPLFSPHSEMMMAPFQHQIALANSMYGLFPPPTVFTYPPQYGTFMQPLQPEQWRQVMASIAFGQMAQPHQGFEMGTPMVGAVPYSPVANQAASVGTSHRCTCGDGCQCVGCAAHPYNEATQNYVRSAWSSMAEETNGATAHANGGHAHTHGHSHSHSNGHGHHHHHDHESINGSHTPTTGDHVDSTSSVMDPALSDANGGSRTAQQEGTSTGPQTPSDAPSSITEEQALSASDFFFVTYPFGDSCDGETASCPCGDDCQCIGCVIHNNPDPE